ncbi:hypothetical protein PUG81_17705 [Erwiniaceae bacterium L1_54_6]|uniref:Colicin M resistance protein n=1 Tax=Pantoea cypripedii TaxID=55209 RepID=A0A6B9GDN9_PANCY|nr:hypothetical protein [Pantoea cypripedii]MDF7660802.1 hypothetical protein [Erwiniaceae bacterium L1_54_6]QGY32347.1 hypothetical protein CUN67_25525 [Pantoea cypripedii]
MIRKIAYSLLMVLIGVILTLSTLFLMMAFGRIFPASEEFQQACPNFDTEQIKNEFIQSWFRMAAKDDSLKAIGLSKVAFFTHPSFAGNSWSGELLVLGEKGKYSATVILDCRNGFFDYTGPFEISP